MNRMFRYAWPALLLVAAVLAPSLAIGITLGVGAVFSLLLVTAHSLEHQLNRSRRRLLFTVIGAELLIFVSLLLGWLDITVARNYALLVLVAAAPLGLEITVRSHQSETLRTAINYAVEDAHTLIIVIGLSFLGTVLLDIPAALSAMQVLFITCVARPLLSGRALQVASRAADHWWRVFFASLTVYGSYVFYYIRHYLEPRHADSINPLTWQATTLALAVFVACQAALLLVNPRAPKVILYRGLALLAALVAVAYLPLTQTYFMTAGLAAADWAWLIIAGLFFVALCLLQRQAATHSRREVLALHREANQ